MREMLWWMLESHMGPPVAEEPAALSASNHRFCNTTLRLPPEKQAHVVAAAERAAKESAAAAPLAAQLKSAVERSSPSGSSQTSQTLQASLLPQRHYAPQQPYAQQQPYILQQPFVQQQPYAPYGYGNNSMMQDVWQPRLGPAALLGPPSICFLHRELFERIVVLPNSLPTFQMKRDTDALDVCAYMSLLEVRMLGAGLVPDKEGYQAL
ncbi:hypothetical protein GGI09_003483 [Coemansia sp. S100]|nr:hypothetical protein GGI09_003483 [Coemansia sp. S100]